MAYVQVGDRQHPLVPGENGIGSVADARVTVPVGPNGVQQMSAVIVVEADGGVVIRRVGEANVEVNGVHLGAEPTPLIHGDKIEIGSTELFFGDDRKGGNTRFVAAVKRPEPASQPGSANKAGVAVVGGVGSRAATGGRLVSLVDGREYVVPDSGWCSAGSNVRRGGSDGRGVAQACGDHGWRRRLHDRGHEREWPVGER